VPQDSDSIWLQNLLIITAIKSDKSRVKDYIHRLDNFDGPAVGEIAVGYEMFEEAFEIYKKFNLQVCAALCTLRGCTSTCDAVAATHPRRLCRSAGDAAPHAPWHMSFGFANRPPCVCNRCWRSRCCSSTCKTWTAPTSTPPRCAPHTFQPALALVLLAICVCLELSDKLEMFGVIKFVYNV